MNPNHFKSSASQMATPNKPIWRMKYVNQSDNVLQFHNIEAADITHADQQCRKMLNGDISWQLTDANKGRE